jgi:hypothetical protein
MTTYYPFGTFSPVFIAQVPGATNPRSQSRRSDRRHRRRAPYLLKVLPAD